jgi:hypothetical protein
LLRLSRGEASKEYGGMVSDTPISVLTPVQVRYTRSGPENNMRSPVDIRAVLGNDGLRACHTPIGS